MISNDSSAPGLVFTNSWFQGAAKDVWDHIVPQISPRRALEIGSYEGASACYLIDSVAKSHEFELHCIDSWGGGVEHQNQDIDMSTVKSRFLSNCHISISRAPYKVNLVVHEGGSRKELARLLAEGKEEYFDLVYVDGSHMAKDVLVDAVLGFHLLATGGVIIFDDYFWSETYSDDMDILASPKLAIDAFTSIFRRQTRFISAPLSQVYLQKIAG